MDLTGVADELYALRPEHFVARRNALAKEAKDGGEQDLAAAVKKLAKPTTAAWVVNMLVRHDPDQVQQILDLGAALRQAQESMAGEQLRELGRQRRQLTSAVTRQARSLAAELGEKVGGSVATQVEETLHAAMVDEGAAAAVRTGMLVRPLAVTGTEAGDVAGSVAVAEALGADVVRRTPPPAGSRKPELTVVEDDSRAIEEAEARVTEAQAAVADAERRLDKARRRVEKREAKALQLRAELEELRRRVGEVEERLEVNDDQLTEAEEVRDDREVDAEQARRTADQARAELDKLRVKAPQRS